MEAVVAGGIAWGLLSPLRADLGQKSQRRLGQFRQLLLRDRRLPEPGQRDEINDVGSEGNLIGAVDENPLPGRRQDEINEPPGGIVCWRPFQSPNPLRFRSVPHLASFLSGKNTPTGQGALPARE